MDAASQQHLADWALEVACCNRDQVDRRPEEAVVKPTVVVPQSDALTMVEQPARPLGRSIW